MARRAGRYMVSMVPVTGRSGSSGFRRGSVTVATGMTSWSGTHGTGVQRDEEKAASNLRKHGVTFDQAGTVFADPLAVIFDDEAHSQDEAARS